MIDLVGEANARIKHTSPQFKSPGNTLGEFYTISYYVVAIGPPYIIFVRQRKKYEESCELIFRFVERISNKRLTSWSIFAKEREWDTVSGSDFLQLIVRKSIWDTASDMALEAWRKSKHPNISTITRYIEGKVGDTDVIARLIELDEVIRREPSFPSATTKEEANLRKPKWKEVSIYRSFDWGNIDLTWAWYMKNIQYEHAAHIVCDAVDKLIEEELSGIMVKKLEAVWPCEEYLDANSQDKDIDIRP
jgi:hypothetical protein